ncbi:MAG: ABC transporter ATP-binding protein [Betaproteobacteria bacterium]|nr:ABC transporter ATP-binding protein [Betaproteobacteria bacterium]
MLDITQLTKTFGTGAKRVTAVDDVTLTLERGVVGLVGHNGAGKTTLMQMIATLSRPTAGSIRFRGTDIVKDPDAIRRRLGFLPQDFGVYPHLTAREFLHYFAALKGVRDVRIVDTLLERVNLREHADRLAANFSGGMRQRLGIALALLNDPDILIVDEPTAGLDPGERVRFRNLLAESGHDRLVIVSTHIVPDIENIASQIAVMRDGKLVAFDTPEAILRSARGQVWHLDVAQEEYESFARNYRVVQAQRSGTVTQLRLVHAGAPAAHALPVEPTLEEALMTPRFLGDAHPATASPVAVAA